MSHWVQYHTGYFCQDFFSLIIFYTCAATISGMTLRSSSRVFVLSNFSFLLLPFPVPPNTDGWPNQSKCICIWYWYVMLLPPVIYKFFGPSWPSKKVKRESKQLQLHHNLQISESSNNICSLYHVISFKRKVKLCFIFPASTSSIYKSRSHPTIYVVYIIPTNHIITITIHHPSCDTIWQNYS